MAREGSPAEASGQASIAQATRALKVAATQPRWRGISALDRIDAMLDDHSAMADYNPNVVSASSTAPKLPDGVVGLDSLDSSAPVDGCRVFTHYNGPTDELSGMCAGMCVLDPGSTPIRRISTLKKNS